MAWEEDAHLRPICQVTRPEAVLDFIGSTTGLAEMCHEFPSYLATYAPQLTIPGFGGDFEPDFGRLLAASCAEYGGRRERKEQLGSGLTTDHLSPSCSEEIALHHEHLGYYKPSSLACQYVQGDIGGPDPKLFETIDYIFCSCRTGAHGSPTGSVVPSSRAQRIGRFGSGLKRGQI
jgi:hypothetical protein